MLIFILFLILLPVTYLCASLRDLFSPDELSEMGIQLKATPSDDVREKPVKAIYAGCH
jgi:hypothetical protein